MTWTRRERKKGVKKHSRRYQTTVRWTGEELAELARLKPEGIKLSEFVRQSALRGSARDGVDQRGGDD